MRILVLSDSHGNIKNMMTAAARTQPDMILHLGDYVRDGDKLKLLYPSVSLLQVEGNCDACDLPGAPLTRTLEPDGHRIFMTHGHQYHVKNDLLALWYAAGEENAELVLFGHTHIPYHESTGGLTLLNPGSIGSSVRPTYAVIETDSKKLAASILEI